MPRRTPQRRERRRPKKAAANAKAPRVVEALEPTPMVEVIRKRRRKRPQRDAAQRRTQHRSISSAETVTRPPGQLASCYHQGRASQWLGGGLGRPLAC